MNTQATSGSRTPEPEIYKSLGLQALCRQMEERSDCRMLELSGASGVNIQFWSRFTPSIHISDLSSNLPRLKTSEDGSPTDPDWERILCLSQDSGFDVILAWDILNYLEHPLIESLIRWIVRFCRPGALLFALIYDRQQMPAAPTVFKIADEERLVYQTRTAEMRACPRHQPRDVQRMMAGFRTASSFQLRHGVREYLFEYIAGQ